MERLPALVYAEWRETLETLHAWTQIVGKIRLRCEPLVNHWWNVTLYVTPRGLTTSTMQAPSGRSFEMTFDFVSHVLHIDAAEAGQREVPLRPMTVADFYARAMEELHVLGIDVRINTMPNEVPDAVPFDRDTAHRSYDAAYVGRFLRALLFADRVCKEFRARFLGKASPVHFFWGSFDLAVTRFSGRRAPPHPGGFPNMPDAATREAYSHEEHSVGFWLGGFGMEALFYAYGYPEPAGFAQSAVRPAAAGWNAILKEFVLPYEAVRASQAPDRDVLAFFQSTYDAEASLAGWDRTALERA